MGKLIADVLMLAILCSSVFTAGVFYEKHVQNSESALLTLAAKLDGTENVKFWRDEAVQACARVKAQ